MREVATDLRGRAAVQRLSTSLRDELTENSGISAAPNAGACSWDKGKGLNLTAPRRRDMITH